MRDLCEPDQMACLAGLALTSQRLNHGRSCGQRKGTPCRSTADISAV